MCFYHCDLTLSICLVFCILCIGYHLVFVFFFFLMIRRPPRSTLDRSSAASDVYKRQFLMFRFFVTVLLHKLGKSITFNPIWISVLPILNAVSYTHLRAHETVLDLVCRLLLEKKKNTSTYNSSYILCHNYSLYI